MSRPGRRENGSPRPVKASNRRVIMRTRSSRPTAQPSSAQKIACSWPRTTGKRKAAKLAWAIWCSKRTIARWRSAPGRLARLREFDPNIGVTNPMDYTLSGLKGEPLKLASLRGKVIVMDFWATWCGPCRVQHPLYEQVKKQVRRQRRCGVPGHQYGRRSLAVQPFLEANQWATRTGLLRRRFEQSAESRIYPDYHDLRQGWQVFSRMNGFVPEKFRRPAYLANRTRRARNDVLPTRIWIVLDSVGIGEMPDAADYGDAGSDTLGNIARQRHVTSAESVRPGPGQHQPLAGTAARENPSAAYGRCALASPGKDTTTGHWEMAGIHLDEALSCLSRLLSAGSHPRVRNRIGRKTLGNCPASGTEIIQRLGDEHVRTGSPIVYTSADSVFQIAAHEDVIPLDRAVPNLRDRPRACFVASTRSAASSRDLSSELRARTRALRIATITPCRRPKACCSTGWPSGACPVHSIGKIADVFLGRGIARSDKTKSNADGMDKTLAAMDVTRQAASSLSISSTSTRTSATATMSKAMRMPLNK